MTLSPHNPHNHKMAAKYHKMQATENFIERITIHFEVDAEADFASQLHDVKHADHAAGAVVRRNKSPSRRQMMSLSIYS